MQIIIAGNNTSIRPMIFNYINSFLANNRIPNKVFGLLDWDSDSIKVWKMKATLKYLQEKQD